MPMIDFIIAVLIYASLFIPPFVLYRLRNSSKSTLWGVCLILVLFQTDKIITISDNPFLETYASVLAAIALIMAIGKTFFVKK